MSIYLTPTLPLLTPTLTTQDQIAKRMEPDTPKPMAAPKPHLKNTQLYKKELDRS